MLRWTVQSVGARVREPARKRISEFNNEKKPGVVFLGEKTNTISLGAIAFF